MRKRIIIFLLSSAAVAFFCFAPVRLTLHLKPGGTYQYETITSHALSVRAEALSGISYPVSRFTLTRTTDGVSKNLKVAAGLLSGTITIAREPVSSVTAVYQGKAEEGSAFHAGDVRVTATYRNGNTRAVRDYKLSGDTKTIHLLQPVLVDTDAYGTLPLLYEDQTSVTGISARPSGKLYEGTEITDETPDVTAVMSDGKTVTLSDWNLDLPDKNAYAGDGQIVYVHTRYGATALDESDVIPITGMYTDTLGTEGDPVPTDGLMVQYADGKTASIDSSYLSVMGTDVLSAGMNRIPVTYHGVAHILYVSASQKTSADRAADMGMEDGDVVAKVSTHQLFASCVRKKSASGTYYVTHLVPASPSCLSAGTPGSTDQAVLVGCGKPSGESATDGHEICLSKTGQFFSPGPGYTSAELDSYGLLLSVQTDAPLLIDNGTTTREGDSRHGGTITGGAIGMTSPGDYYILTSDDALTWRDMQDILFSYGCVYARGLTGSGYLSIDGKTISGSVPGYVLSVSGKEG